MPFAASAVDPWQIKILLNQSLVDLSEEPHGAFCVCAGAQYLGVIMFAIVFAIILNTLGPPAEPLIRVIEIANDAIMAMVRGI